MADILKFKKGSPKFINPFVRDEHNIKCPTCDSNLYIDGPGEPNNIRQTMEEADFITFFTVCENKHKLVIEIPILQKGSFPHIRDMEELMGEKEFKHLNNSLTDKEKH